MEVKKIASILAIIAVIFGLIGIIVLMPDDKPDALLNWLDNHGYDTTDLAIQRENTWMLSLYSCNPPVDLGDGSDPVQYWQIYNSNPGLFPGRNYSIVPYPPQDYRIEIITITLSQHEYTKLMEIAGNQKIEEYIYDRIADIINN